MKLITKIRRLFGRKKGTARQVRESKSKALVDDGCSSATRVTPSAAPLTQEVVEEEQDAPLFADVPTTSDAPSPATFSLPSPSHGASNSALSALHLLPFFCELEPDADCDCTQQDEEDLTPAPNGNGQYLTGSYVDPSPLSHCPAENEAVEGKAPDVDWDYVQVPLQVDEELTPIPGASTAATFLNPFPFADFPIVLEDIEEEAPDAAETPLEDEDLADVYARYPTKSVRVFTFSDTSESSLHSAEIEDSEAQAEPSGHSVHFKDSTEYGATPSQAIRVPADTTDSESVYSYKEEAIPSVTLGDSLGSAAAMPQTPYPPMHDSFSATEVDDPLGDDDLVTSSPVSPIGTDRSYLSNNGIPSTVTLRLPETRAIYRLSPHMEASDSSFGSLFVGERQDEEGERIAVKVINKKEIQFLKKYVDNDSRNPRLVFRNEEDARKWARKIQRESEPKESDYQGKMMTTLASLRAELKALKRIRDTSSLFAGGFIDVVQDSNYIYMAMPLYEEIETPGLKDGWLWVRRVFAQAVLGVESLHKNGIVHRDLKPSNFMQMCQCGRGGYPRLRIIDFGLAIVVDEENPQEIYMSGWSGTEGFVAPEVEESDDWDNTAFSGTKGDIFALGISILVTLCAMLAVPMTMVRDPEKTEKPDSPRHFDLPTMMLRVHSMVGTIEDENWTEEIDLLLDLIEHMTHWNCKKRFGFSEVKAHGYFDREHILDEALELAVSSGLAVTESCLSVLKDGCISNLTLGRYAGLESFLCDENGVRSLELAIYNYVKKSKPFSLMGDSGSLIVNGKGEMVGLLHSGMRKNLKHSTAAYITYATPAWRLCKWIKEVYPHADFTRETWRRRVVSRLSFSLQPTMLKLRSWTWRVTASGKWLVMFNGI